MSRKVRGKTRIRSEMNFVLGNLEVEQRAPGDRTEGTYFALRIFTALLLQSTN